MKNKKDMHIKIQKGSPNGVSNNKGSCRNLAEYLNHEDTERKEMGLEILPFTTPEGEEISLEEVVQSIDENGKGLSKDDNKFFHLVVAPSQEEIEAMGENDQIIYHNAQYLIRAISRAYAQHFNREGIEDESDLVIFWKPHWTRGQENTLQFHLHAIVSRKTRGRNGKQLKISPLTNHRQDTEGPIHGGFDRNAFAEKCERLFDRLYCFERQLSKSFEYQNALAHGTVEDKAAQADRLAQETIGKMKESIDKNINQKKEAPELDIPEEGLDSLETVMEISDSKNRILEIFHNQKDPNVAYLELAALGLTCKAIKSADGLEEMSISMDGTTLSSRDIMDDEEHEAFLEDVGRLTGYKIGEKVREEQAELEAEKEISQHKRGLSLGL